MERQEQIKILTASYEALCKELETEEDYNKEARILIRISTIKTELIKELKNEIAELKDRIEKLENTKE